MALEVKGIIERILEVQTWEKKDGSGILEKQNFIVKTDSQYNNIYCFEIFGDQKIDNFAKYNKVGQEVTVEFNVNTSEWQGKFFTTLSAWKITATPLQNSGQTQTAPLEAKPMTNCGEEDDTLPF